MIDYDTLYVICPECIHGDKILVMPAVLYSILFLIGQRPHSNKVTTVGSLDQENAFSLVFHHYVLRIHRL